MKTDQEIAAIVEKDYNKLLPLTKAFQLKCEELGQKLTEDQVRAMIKAMLWARFKLE